MSSGIQIIGVTKKRIRTTLATIGGTSRKRAETIPSSSPAQMTLRQRRMSPGTTRSPVQPGQTEKMAAATTKITALWRKMRRLRQKTRYTWTDRGRPTCLMMLSALMNAAHPSVTTPWMKVQTTKPTARNGMYSATSTFSSVPYSVPSAPTSTPMLMVSQNGPSKERR